MARIFRKSTGPKLIEAKNNTSKYQDVPVFTDNVKQEHPLYIELQKKIDIAEKRLEELQKNYKAEKDIITKEVQDIENRAEEILKNADETSSKTISEATKKSEQILKEANEGTELAAQRIREKARVAGFEEGKNQAIADLKKQYGNYALAAQNLLTDIQNQKEIVLNSIEPFLLELILRACKKIIKIEVSINQNVIKENMLSALSKISLKENLIIKVNEKDLEIAQIYKEDYIDKLKDTKNIKVITDKAVAPGGCLIESPFGSIDALLESQISNLEEAIYKALSENISDE